MGWTKTKVQSARRRLLVTTVLGMGLSVPASGQDLGAIPSFNLYGNPGLIDMPTALVAPDATLSTTVSNFGDSTRTTLSFQITPRLSGSFRYSSLRNLPITGAVDGTYFDRSFDLRYQLVTEGDMRPAVALGLQDFIGTGAYGGEYIVATKTVLPGLQVTGGLGWGRLGSANPLASFGERPRDLLEQGGVPTYDRWFRGDMGAFAGIAYSPSEQLTFTAEYSSDAYRLESERGSFERKSDWNFGLDYKLNESVQVSLYHLYGNEIGAQVSLFANPKTSIAPGGVDTAPLPVKPRAPGAARDLGWTDNIAGMELGVSAAMRKLMDVDGIVVEGVDLTANTATIRMRNPRFGSAAQAVGRTARAATLALPASVENISIVPVAEGIGLSAVTFRRSDLEALENDDAAAILARTRMTDAHRLTPGADDELYPDFVWSLSPYLALSVFDPESPVRADAGLRLTGEYRLAPNLSLSGSVAKKLTGNLDESTRDDATSLPRVRTLASRYSSEGDPAIEYLTLSHFSRPAEDLYGRVTVGYLEPMYGGISGELLWKPVDSRLGLGVELNYVEQREFEQLFGFRDLEGFDNVTGHASAYYDFGNGFHGQLDVGRYLAGDYGATVTVDREFANGWRVGAYATLTDVPFEDFGEGSFDKGIRVTVPLDWATGTATRRRSDVTIRSLTRDGGARLNVNDRLYEKVREYHEPDLSKGWGKFWR